MYTPASLAWPRCAKVMRAGGDSGWRAAGAATGAAGGAAGAVGAGATAAAAGLSAAGDAEPPRAGAAGCGALQATTPISAMSESSNLLGMDSLTSEDCGEYKPAERAALTLDRVR